MLPYAWCVCMHVRVYPKPCCFKAPLTAQDQDEHTTGLALDTLEDIVDDVSNLGISHLFLAHCVCVSQGNCGAF